MTTRQSVYYSILLVICLVLLYLFWVREMRFFLVPSSSMEPTLYPRDYLLTLNAPEYRRGDIVVLKDPTRPRRGEYLVKRIAGVGGDIVEVNMGALLINGDYASEPYILEPMGYVMDPVMVPPGEVLVLGDNRNESDDSSRWQRKTVLLEDVVGKVKYIYLPISRAQRVIHYPLTNTRGE